MRSAVFFVLAITLTAALGMSFRHRRQSADNDDNNLDDRYGWNRPQQSWGDRPWLGPKPNQGGNQRPRPNQGGNQGPQPDQGNQWPNQNGNGQNQQQNNNEQPQPTPAPNGNGSTTQSDAVQECIRNCLVTSEYNPVCGTNMVQYPNPGRLTCAQNCGVILVALSTRIATAGRYFRNDGHNFHSFEQVDPYKWHDDRDNWDDARGTYPQKFHKPRQQEGDNKEFWESHHPEGCESHSRSDSWEYPDFPAHHHHNHNWNEQPSMNWNQGLPNHGGHKPNGNHWNQGGNNQQGSWNQGANRPNWNQGGNRPNWNQGGSNSGSNQPSQFNPDWQNQQGRPGNNNGPRPTSNQAGPGDTLGQPTTTTSTATTQAPLAIALCIRSCPVTSEYNPVCGSNNVTYGNAGRLECARYCGVDVTIQRNLPCPANNTQNFPPRPANNTNLPFPDPTRFTTIDAPSTTLSPADSNLDSSTTSKFTISQDVLNSIFTSTQSTNSAGGGGATDDDNYDIDIRTRNRNNFLNAQPNFFYDAPPFTSS